MRDNGDGDLNTERAKAAVGAAESAAKGNCAKMGKDRRTKP